MENKKTSSVKNTRLRFVDFVVVILCILGAVYCFNLFRNDLSATISLQNEEPVGTVVAKNNIVQRRLSNSMLWGRLEAESPIYMGDFIRVSELSEAMLYIDDTHINLDENTLIRIQPSETGESPLQITLDEGGLSLNSGENAGNLTLNLNGQMVGTGAGTVLSTKTEGDGLVLSVSSGTAVFVGDHGQSRKVPSGAMLALDSQGAERAMAAAVVTNPKPGSRFLKNTSQPLLVDFFWNRFNIEPDAPLLLEVSEARNFDRSVNSISTSGDRAQVSLGAGSWYWRLLFDDAEASGTVLATGRFTVTDSTGPGLASPATGSLFRYDTAMPTLNFQWSQTTEASSYIFQIADTPDFSTPKIVRQTAATFLTEPNLGPGTWYWRVMPAFPPVFEGKASFSQVSFFQIEQQNNTTEESAIMVLPEPAVSVPEPKATEIKLISPAPAVRLDGLTALRQETVFRWESDAEATRSRFILSRNSNPAGTAAAVEIPNPPGRTVRLDGLEQGIWYWTAEEETANNGVITTEIRQLEVLPIPLLPAPGNRRPAQGSRIGIEDLRQQRNIVFNWARVPGANAYIFSLYRQTPAGRQRVISNPPENTTSWTLADIGILDSGNFVWQVEAVNIGTNSIIDQHGTVAENSFVLDIPTPGPVRLQEPGILYGQ